MTKNSYLCNFIANHPDDWESILTDKYAIKIKREGDLAIFTYRPECDYYDAILQESRGIIINIASLEVVCWPFRKFGNYNEGYSDPIDWSSARVQEKVDGSIIKLWFDKSLNKWQFSTNGMIRAENAPVEKKIGITYADIINNADNVNDIPYDKLNKDYTYIFELVSPDTRVVVKYDNASLYHLGTRSNVTGKEFDIDIGIKKPRQFPLSSLDNCISAVIELNKNMPEGENVRQEGFVVVDKNWNRVKIKSPDYIMVHHFSTMKTIAKKECVSILLNEREKLESIFESIPEIVPAIKYYDYKIAELFHDAEKMSMFAQSLYEEFSHEKKAVADVIADHRLALIGFRCLKGDRTAKEVLLELPFDRFCNLIPDYVPENLSLLFLKKKPN